jgi:hypothetical protein
VCNICQQAHLKEFWLFKVHLKPGTATNRKFVVNMVEFYYHFAKVALHLIYLRMTFIAWRICGFFEGAL